MFELPGLRVRAGLHRAWAIKYLERENAPELVQYLREADNPRLDAIGLRFDWTEHARAWRERCDFRVSRDEPVHAGPEFPHA